MASKRCVNCKKSLPEHLVEKHKFIYKSPICPICARTLINKMRGNPPGTPFKELFKEDDHREAVAFLSNQCVNNRGGHLINPPNDCEFRILDDKTGTLWVDLGRCINACDKLCPRFYEYKRMTHSERREELIDNGVRLY